MLDQQTKVNLARLLYRYRFLFFYVVIGVLSLCVEVILFRGLTHLGVPVVIGLPVGFVAGICFAYWLNVRLNFKVPVAKRRRAFAYFVLIALLSGALNYGFRTYLFGFGFSYESSRFIISGLLFSIAYYFHRRFSFSDRKQVGVAIYANKVEDIATIFAKVGNFPDFIHVDIIDDTFGDALQDPHTYRLEAIRAYWPRKQIHVHLMTRRPLRWLGDILPFCDVVIPHVESDDALPEVFARIHAAGKRAGICLCFDTPLAAVEPYLAQCELVQFLSIARPGRSGQAFQMSTLDRIAEFTPHPRRRALTVCIDGGVSERTIQLLNVEMVISGSSVLNHPQPQMQIMRLQSSSNYEAT